MSGNLDMEGNIKPFVENDNANQSGRLSSVIFTIREETLKRIINETSLENLAKDGSQSMTGNLSMSNNKINS